MRGCLRAWAGEEGCSAADVRLFPFHAASTGLPELEQGTWRDIMMCSSGRSSAAGSGAEDGGAEHSPGARPRQRTAGILLAEPHFIAVGGSRHAGNVATRSLVVCLKREKIAGPVTGSRLVTSMHESCTASSVLSSFSAVQHMICIVLGTSSCT